MPLQRTKPGPLAKGTGFGIVKRSHASDTPEHNRDVQSNQDAKAKALVEQRIAEALRIWREASPLDGSFGALYLRAYGCAGPFGRFSSLRFREFNPPIWPAIVAGIQDPGGRLTGVELTILHPTDLRIAALPHPKIVLGELGDGAVRFCRAAEDPDIAVTIEDALLLAERGWPAWACLSPERRRQVKATSLEGTAS